MAHLGQVAALHAKLLSVCREACEARADYTVFPEEWLFHHRYFWCLLLLGASFKAQNKLNTPERGLFVSGAFTIVLKLRH